MANIFIFIKIFTDNKIKIIDCVNGKFSATSLRLRG